MAVHLLLLLWFGHGMADVQNLVNVSQMVFVYFFFWSSLIFGCVTSRQPVSVGNIMCMNMFQHLYKRFHILNNIHIIEKQNINAPGYQTH